VTNFKQMIAVECALKFELSDIHTSILVPATFWKTN